MNRDRDRGVRTRASLLGRLRDWQDQQSWQQFYDTYWRLIYSAAIHAGLTDAEAQEVVQETVISVAKTMPQFQYDPQVCSFKSWLGHLTRKRIVDQLRKRPRVHISLRAGADEKETSTVDRIADPASLNLDALWDREWEQNLLAAALERVKDQVSAEQYQMFDLYVLREWPAAKVARALEIGLGQVYLAKFRIRRLVKKEIERIKSRMR